MAMAALGNVARRLASQPPPAIHRAEVPRRLFHGGSSAVGRSFSLEEEQRRLLPRLTYSRQFHSLHRDPVTFMDKVKEAYELYILTCELLDKVSIVVLKLACLGGCMAVAFLLSREEQVPKGGREAQVESS